jgi:proline dehydrogenase
MITKFSFDNTADAFGHKSMADLLKTFGLFAIMNQKWLVNFLQKTISWSFKVGLPIGGLVKVTAFKQFCGGENLSECEKKVKRLAKNKVGTILDYSVEGENDEKSFEETFQELLKSIEKAANNPNIPFAVFKVSGIADVEILNKIQSKQNLSNAEIDAVTLGKARFEQLCAKAAQLGVRLFVDAEESWFQDVIDDWTVRQMALYNKTEVLIYNTYQLYRHDILEKLKNDINVAQNNNYKIGAKLVRGAYMEKERERAQTMGYKSPIQANKEATDTDYNLAIDFGITHKKHIAICLGTHNAYSSSYLAEQLLANDINKNDINFYFAQLLGMSDNISYTLAKNGFNVAKYVPYGPVKAVLPYLFRRAQENTAMAGQSSREYTMLKREFARRFGLN